MATTQKAKRRAPNTFLEAVQKDAYFDYLLPSRPTPPRCSHKMTNVFGTFWVGFVLVAWLLSSSWSYLGAVSLAI